MITYLCGGINGLTDSQCVDWRAIAHKHLTTDTLDPMRRDYRGREGEFVTEIVQGDLEDIRLSAFILVNALRPSWGTAMEIVYAYKLAKNIVSFVGTGAVSPWLRFHCTHVETTLEDAVSRINAEAGVYQRRLA